jgi:DNA-binding MarR family transcriptional regulator
VRATREMTVRLNAIETRIMEILRQRYPITVEELREELSIRRDTLTLTLKSLASKGVIALEPLPDKTYVRLLAAAAGTGAALASPGDGMRNKNDDSIAYR